MVRLALAPPLAGPMFDRRKDQVTVRFFDGERA
jgi:hypothetical protein